MRLTIKLLRDLTVRSTYQLEPVPKCTIAQQALKALEINPENPVIIDGLTGDVTTRGQLAEQILRVAGWVSQNIEKGDVIGLSLPNITQYMSTALGSIHAGGVVSLFNPIYTHSELEHTVGLVKPKLIFTSALSLDTFKAINSSVEKYVVFGPEIEGTISAKVVFTSDQIAEGVGVEDFNDTTLLPLSSGTTGLPKAVCLSHRNCVTYNVITMHDHFGTLGPGKNCLMLLPKFHAYGFTMSLNSILKGAVYTILPRFQLDTFLAAIQNYGITHVPIVPPIAAVLAKHPMVDEYDLKSIETVLCAAAPLSSQLQKLVSDRLNVDCVRNGWGMSEFCAAAICPRPSASVDSMKKGSVGEVLPGLEVRVLDIENREPLGPNSEGELAVRGGTVMKGYLGNPGATAATIDEDGWLLTGDLGMYDENENFYITGRLKELIKYKGWQIAPAELEDVLITHEAVADCAVVGVEAEEDGDGEVPRAFIVVKSGYNPTPQDIQSFIKDNMASYKQLKGGVVFIETIPRSLAGKILRKELKKM